MKGEDNMQRAIFPILKTWESQSMYIGSHTDTKAIDFGVLNPYNDKELKAPFDGKVVHVDPQNLGGGIAFESLNKVKYVDGTEDHMTLWTGHDNNPPKVGTIFKQGEVYSHMGTAGGVAIHCHLEVQKGKFKMPTKITSQGAYLLDNAVEPFNALFLNKDGLIKYSKYKWTSLPKIEVTTVVERNENISQIRVIVDNLRVRAEHSTNSSVIGFVQNKGIYNDLETYNDGTYIWHRIDKEQWIADNGEWLEVLPVTDYKKLYESKLSMIESLNKQISTQNDTINNLNEKLSKINELSKI